MTYFIQRSHEAGWRYRCRITGKQPGTAAHRHWSVPLVHGVVCPHAIAATLGVVDALATEQIFNTRQSTSQDIIYNNNNDSSSLDPHHSHFLFVDTGMRLKLDGNSTFGGEIALRAEFEQVR